jgi:hypothetical protein
MGEDNHNNNNNDDAVGAQSIELAGTTRGIARADVRIKVKVDPDGVPRRRYVIRATHEYSAIPLSANEVQVELKSRTYNMAKQLWDAGTINGITSGVRVQSARGRHGRMPIVGRLNTTATIGNTTGSSSCSSGGSNSSRTTSKAIIYLPFEPACCILIALPFPQLVSYELKSLLCLILSW